MINRIIEWSLKNRVLVLALFLGAGVWGYWALIHTPIDAIPDLSDNQVIVFTDWAGRSPQEVEDQVTYPIAAEMLKVPGSRVVRGYSYFGVSFVYIIFDDGTDLYWARSRVLEYLNGLKGRLPATVSPTLGPDATGLGWVFQYALEDTTGKMNLADLRSLFRGKLAQPAQDGRHLALASQVFVIPGFALGRRVCTGQCGFRLEL